MFICVCVCIYILVFIFLTPSSKAMQKKTEKQCFVKGTENESLEVTTFFALERKQVHEGKITYQKKDMGHHTRW